MAWVILLLAGVMEATWALALSKSNGFKRLIPTVIFVIASVLSLLGLSIAMKDIQTGTAYAVWTGTGAALTAIWAISTKQDKATPKTFLFLALLIACIVGLQLVS